MSIASRENLFTEIEKEQAYKNLPCIPAPVLIFASLIIREGRGRYLSQGCRDGLPS
jgi:hypothetical protein